MNRLKNNRGATIIEALLVLIAMAILSQVLFYIMFQNYRMFEGESSAITSTHEVRNTIDYVVKIARNATAIRLDANNRLILETDKGDYRFNHDSVNYELIESKKDSGDADIVFDVPGNTRTVLNNVTTFSYGYMESTLDLELYITEDLELHLDSGKGRLFNIETQVINRNNLGN